MSLFLKVLLLITVTVIVFATYTKNQVKLGVVQPGAEQSIKTGFRTQLDLSEDHGLVCVWVAKDQYLFCEDIQNIPQPVKNFSL